MNLTSKQLQSITRIYDVLLDSSLWTDVLDELSNQVRAEGTSLLITDHISEELSAIHLSSKLLPWVQDYLDRGLDEAEMKLTLDVPRLIKQQGLVGLSEIASELNRNFQTNHDLSAVEKWSRESFNVYHRYSSPLGFDPAYFDITTFQFGNIAKDSLQQSLKLANLYLPHMQKAVELSRPFKLLHARFNAVLSVLDRLHLGVAILTKDGSIVINNQAVERVFEAGDGLLKNPKNKLIAKATSDNVVLREAISTVCALIDGKDNTKAKPFSVSRSSNATPYIVEVSALSNRDIDIGGNFTGILVIMIDPDHHSIIETSGLEALFDLTEAETEVCRLLISGQATAEIAETRNSHPDTVRKQINSLLQKTNSSRRTDLVRLALSINLPVDDSD